MWYNLVPFLKSLDTPALRARKITANMCQPCLTSAWLRLRQTFGHVLKGPWVLKRKLAQLLLLPSPAHCTCALMDILYSQTPAHTGCTLTELTSPINDIVRETGAGWVQMGVWFAQLLQHTGAATHKVGDYQKQTRARHIFCLVYEALRFVATIKIK